MGGQGPPKPGRLVEVVVITVLLALAQVAAGVAGAEGGSKATPLGASAPAAGAAASQQKAAALRPHPLNNATAAKAGSNGTATQQRPKPVAVQGVKPSSVTQFVPNRVTVDVNASLCGAAKKPLGRSGGAAGAGTRANAARLHLRNARADGRDAVFAGNVTGNCTHLVFPVTPDADVRSGSFVAKVSAPGGVTVQLPGNITVVRPVTVTPAVGSVQVPADGSPAEIRVQLSQPQKAFVRVRLQLSDGALQFVGDDHAQWNAGEVGERSLKLRVAFTPKAGRIVARIVDPEGGVVVPVGNSEIEVVVLSPVLSFEPTKQALLRGSSDTLRIPLRVSGSSVYPSSWGYSTYLLPGSRPVDNGTCTSARGYAPGCVGDWDARANLSTSGTIWVQPGQTAVPPLQLVFDWERVPYEAEYMVGVRLLPLVNGRAAPQALTAAAAVYGAPPGHCPPGTALRRDAPKRAADGPMYGATAALQELHLLVEGLGAAGGGSNSSSNASAAAAAANASSALDLDPPFKPLTDRYEVLLPYAARDAELVMSSTREGDSVTVDASGCNSLASREYLVTWNRRSGARMWRARYGLRAQRRPCWLRVHVFTSQQQPLQQQFQQHEDGAGDSIPDVLQPQAAAATDGRASMLKQPPQQSAPPQGPVDEGGVRRVLYRTYTIRLVPLSPPQSLSLRSISFSNATATLVACGVPSRFAHLFAQPRQGGARSIGAITMGNSSNGGGAASSTGRGGERPLPAPLVAAANQRPLVAFYLNAPALGAAAAQRAAAAAAVAAAVAAQQQERQQQQEKEGEPEPKPQLPGPANSSGGSQRRRLQQLDAPRQQPTQALFRLRDAATNHTVIWSQFALSECVPDRFLLVPLGHVLALGPDARMTPELLDKTAQGVRVGMSGTALAMSPDDEEEGATAGGRTGGGSGGLGGRAAGGLLAAALLDGIRGNGSAPGAPLPAGQDANSTANGKNASSAAAAAAALEAAGGRRVVGGRLTAPRLPGASLELPVITTADDGLSSKTYTLVLYSNVSSAVSLFKMRAAGNGTSAGADGDAAATARRGGAAGSGSASEQEEEARLQKDAFGSRPRDWPPSPGQNSNCSLCAQGTYSTKLDSAECQVCPPGKFSGSPYSTGCALCPEGSFSYFWGADACRTCLPGTFAPRRGSLYCNICPDGRTTLGDGASDCDVSVADLKTPEYVIMLSFGVVLSGASLGAVSRDTTGINASSEGIVAVLVRSDTASALNVGLEAVTIGGVQQISRRRLLVNVSAAVPVNTEDAAVADTEDLSADALIQRLIDDPNAFLRTTQTLGAESAAITDLTTQTLHTAGGRGPNLHAVLWPTLLGAGLLAGSLGYSAHRWRRRRRRVAGARWRGGGGGLAPIIGADGAYPRSDFTGGAFGGLGGGGGGMDVDSSGAGGGAMGRLYPPRGGWWSRFAGRRRGGGSGPARLEVAFADLRASGSSSGDGSGVGAPSIDPEGSPRDDSFASILRLKQQQHQRRAAVAAAGRSDADGDADVGAAAAPHPAPPTFGGFEGRRARGAARRASSAADSQEGPPSDMADSATELATLGTRGPPGVGA